VTSRNPQVENSVGTDVVLNEISQKRTDGSPLIAGSLPDR
jgi:hypothetical protein